MTFPQQITTPPQNLAEVPTNENFEALAHQSVYANAAPTTSLLTWGYYGGTWGGFAVADGTFTLAASSTTYITAKISDGSTQASTDITHWNDAANYARVYEVVTGASTISAVTDFRAGPGGALGGGGGGGGGGGAVSSLTTTGTSGAATLASGVLNIPVYGGGSGGDYIATTVNSRVVVNGNLTVTAFGKNYVCVDAATPVNYTITLPSAVGNLGKRLSFYMEPALTKMVTFVCQGTQTIGRVSTFPLFAGEALTIESDNANWMVTSSTWIPMVGSLRLNTSGSAPNATKYQILFDNVLVDTPTTIGGVMCDTVNHRIVIPRNGRYEMAGLTILTSATMTNLLLDIFANGSQVFEKQASCASASVPAVADIGPVVILCTLGAVYDMRVYQNSGSAQTVVGSSSILYTYFSVKELGPPWQ